MESLSANKKMMEAAMQQLHLFKTGDHQLQSYKDFA